MSEIIQRNGMRTSNFERPTSNFEPKQKSNTFDLEERLLDYAADVIRTVELLPKGESEVT
jgi:purine nucleoside permease